MTRSCKTTSVCCQIKEREEISTEALFQPTLCIKRMKLMKCGCFSFPGSFILWALPSLPRQIALLYPLWIFYKRGLFCQETSVCSSCYYYFSSLWIFPSTGTKQAFCKKKKKKKSLKSLKRKRARNIHSDHKCYNINPFGNKLLHLVTSHRCPWITGWQKKKNCPPAANLGEITISLTLALSRHPNPRAEGKHLLDAFAGSSCRNDS